MGKLIAPVPEEHLKAIGQITVNFALLENTISSFVGMLISSDQRVGQIITAELSFRNLVGLLSSLYKHFVNESEKIEELDALLTTALTIEEKRNIVTHSLWGAGYTHETITRIKMTAKKAKGLRHQYEQMSAEDLSKIAERIAELSHDVQMLMIRQIDPDFRKQGD
jgi:hypothetical protein